MSYAFYGSYWCETCKRFTKWLFVGDEPDQCTEHPHGDGERQK